MSKTQTKNRMIDDEDDSLYIRFEKMDLREDFVEMEQLLRRLDSETASSLEYHMEMTSHVFGAWGLQKHRKKKI